MLVHHYCVGDLYYRNGGHSQGVERRLILISPSTVVISSDGNLFCSVSDSVGSDVPCMPSKFWNWCQGTSQNSHWAMVVKSLMQREEPSGVSLHRDGTKPILMVWMFVESAIYGQCEFQSCGICQSFQFWSCACACDACPCDLVCWMCRSCKFLSFGLCSCAWVCPTIYPTCNTLGGLL